MEMILKELGRQLDDLTREFYEKVLPPVDMYEEGGTLNVLVDLPGFPKQNISVRVRSDSTLIIDASKDEERNPGLRYSSQRPRRVHREIRLPVKVPRDATVDGKYEEGVLKLKIPIEGSVRVRIE